MTTLNDLKKLQHSKKATQSMPIAVRVLESHDERIRKLESLISGPSDATPFTSVEEVSEDPVIITTQEPEEVLEDEEGMAYIDELLSKLLEIQDEASLVESELNSIKQMDEQHEKEAEDDDDFDTVSLNTECTEACQEVIANIPDDSSLLSNPCDGCKTCIKKKAREYKKEKKRIDKERRLQVKDIKRKQKELLLYEQSQITMKLNDFKLNIDTCVDLSSLRKDELTHELNKLESTVARLET